MKRIAFFTYGVVCYALFFGTFLYGIGFLGNLVVPKSIDSGPVFPLAEALPVNAALLALFAVQHSVMARRGFKKWWTKFVPKPIERSTYVLFSSLCLDLLFWQWRAMGGTIWSVQNPVGEAALLGVFGFGVTLVLVSTFLINHFDLFGLRQVWLYLRGKEYTPLRFRIPTLYKIVRHPMYVGWMCFFWGAPTMTAARLAFASACTLYILIAIPIEERDLVAEHGKLYADYRRRVPALIPVRRAAAPSIEIGNEARS